MGLIPLFSSFSPRATHRTPRTAATTTPGSPAAGHPQNVPMFARHHRQEAFWPPGASAVSCKSLSFRAGAACRDVAAALFEHRRRSSKRPFSASEATRPVTTGVPLCRPRHCQATFGHPNILCHTAGGSLSSWTIFARRRRWSGRQEATGSTDHRLQPTGSGAPHARPAAALRGVPSRSNTGRPLWLRFRSPNESCIRPARL